MQVVACACGTTGVSTPTSRASLPCCAHVPNRQPQTLHPPTPPHPAHLHVGAHDGHLHRDDDGQDGHQEGKAKDVVEVALRGGRGGWLSMSAVHECAVQATSGAGRAEPPKYGLPRNAQFLFAHSSASPTCHSEVMAKYSSTKMVPNGSRPAAKNSTSGWLAQWGGGMCRGICAGEVGGGEVGRVSNAQGSNASRN